MSMVEEKISEDDLTCPVTSELFCDPVDLVCSKGEKPHVFEKEVVQRLLLEAPPGLDGRSTACCPTCRAPIKSYKLRPDIKQQVDSHIAGNTDKIGDRYQPSNVEEDQGSDNRPPRRYQPRTKKAWFWLRMLLILAGLAAGIYLATLIVPAIITALIAAGLAPAWALVSGIIAGVGIVYGVTMVSAPEFFLLHLCWEIYICRKYPEQIEDGSAIIWHTLAALGGVGFGIYAAVSIAPLLIASLTAIGLYSSVAVFMAVVSTFIFIHLASLYLGMLFGKIPLLTNAIVIWKSQEMGFFSKGIHFIGLLAGIGLGIYLAVLLAPPVMAYFAAVPLGAEIIFSILLLMVTVIAKLLLAVTALFVRLVQYAHIKLTRPEREIVQDELHAENPVLGRALIARALVIAEPALSAFLILWLVMAAARNGGEQQALAVRLQPQIPANDEYPVRAQYLCSRQQLGDHLCLFFLAQRRPNHPNYNADASLSAQGLDLRFDNGDQTVASEAREFLDRLDPRISVGLWS